MGEDKKAPAKRSPDQPPTIKSIRAIWTAGQILEIYATQPNPWKSVCERFGTPRDHATGKKWNSEELLAWAMGRYLRDDAKKLAAVRVVAELERIGFASIGDFLTFDAKTGRRVLAVEHVTADQLAAVERIEVDQTSKGIQSVEISLHNKMPALLALGRITGAIPIAPMRGGGGGGALADPLSFDPMVHIEEVRTMIRQISQSGVVTEVEVTKTRTVEG